MFGCYEEFEDFVCKRIGGLRSQNNLSARDMSLSMGQNAAYINNIENKNSLPSLKGFYYICDFFRIAPKEFFDDDVSYPMLMQELIKDLNGLNDKQLEHISAIIKDMKKR